MALPQAIQAQEEAAEQLRKQVYEGQAIPPVENQPAPEPAVEPPVTSNVVELQPNATPAPVVVSPVEPAETLEYWKERFKTVQGKLDTEMPRLYQQLREQSQQISQLVAQQKAKEPPPAPAAPAEPHKLVTQKDVDDYGQDMIDAIRRVAREEAEQRSVAERAVQETKITAVETRVDEVSSQVAQSESAKFWGTVNQIIPDWTQVDANPAWISWLDTAPDFSEFTYRQLAGQAIQKGNAQKVAKLVETWKRETGQVTPAVPATPTPTAVQQELSRQVAPSTVKSPSAPVIEKLMSRQEYEALYDVRNPRRFGEKRANEMIAEADRALAEGRIQW